MDNTTRPRHLFFIRTKDGDIFENYYSDASIPRVGEKIDFYHINSRGIYKVVDIIHEPSEIYDDIKELEAPISKVTCVKIIVAKE